MFLVELFPHDELRTAPTPQPPGDAARISGKIDPHLHEDVVTRCRRTGYQRQPTPRISTHPLASVEYLRQDTSGGSTPNHRRLQPAECAIDRQWCWVGFVRVDLGRRPRCTKSAIALIGLEGHSVLGRFLNASVTCGSAARAGAERLRSGRQVIQTSRGASTFR